MSAISGNDGAIKRTLPAAAVPIDAYRPLRVMVVDDNHINLTVLSTLLKRRFSVMLDGAPVCVDSGLKAIQLLRTHVFDLILMDIQMPFLSGLDATLRIRSGQDGVMDINRHAHIVAVTTAIGDEPEAAYRRAGMDGMIGKPVRFQDMQQYLCPLSREAHRAAVSVLHVASSEGDVMPPLPPVDAQHVRIFYLPADATVRAPRPEICKGADFESMLRAQTRASLRRDGAFAIARSGTWSNRSTSRHRSHSIERRLQENSNRISEEEDIKAYSSSSTNSEGRTTKAERQSAEQVSKTHSRPSSMTVNKRIFSQQIAQELANIDGYNSDTKSGSEGVRKGSPPSHVPPRRPAVIHRMSSPAWLLEESSETDVPQLSLAKTFKEAVAGTFVSFKTNRRPNWTTSLKLQSDLANHDAYDFVQSPQSSSLDGQSDGCQDAARFRNLCDIRRDSQQSTDSCASDISADLTTPSSEVPDGMAEAWVSVATDRDSLHHDFHVRSLSTSSTATAEAHNENSSPFLFKERLDLDAKKSQLDRLSRHLDGVLLQ